MKKNLLLWIFCLSGLLISCDKNQETFDFPVTLRAVKMVKNGDVRMFIGGKEQFDHAVLSKFTDTDFFKKQEENLSGTMSFESADNVVFNSNESLPFSVKKENDVFLFYSSNSVITDNES
ncbi:MAG TPA: hypothetical protein DEF88_01035, partial [Porphyromonadaceae bacterium]|nr:hypothetical protein [Porphyromonadaceae bacterium]